MRSERCAEWLLSLVARELTISPSRMILAADRWRERTTAFIVITGLTWTVLMVTPAAFLVAEPWTLTRLPAMLAFLGLGMCLRRRPSTVPAHA